MYFSTSHLSPNPTRFATSTTAGLFVRVIMEKGLKRPLFVGEPLTPEKRHKVNVDHVQITAPTEEVDSRIQAFVASKRELNNQSNRREFRSLDPDILESVYSVLFV